MEAPEVLCRAQETAERIPGERASKRAGERAS